MAVQVNAGKTVFISADLPATNDAAGFAAAGVVFTEIAEITSVSGFGRTNNEASYSPLATQMIKRQKGSYDYAPLAIDATYDSLDAGQAICITANGSAALYSLKVVYASGQIEYAQCYIMAFDIAGGGVDDFVSVSISAQANEDVIRVAAV
jgi:hypothetical protein